MLEAQPLVYLLDLSNKKTCFIKWVDHSDLCYLIIIFFVQFPHPDASDWQWDRVDEHAVQGEVPEGHAADGGEAQQLHLRQWKVTIDF